MKNIFILFLICMCLVSPLGARRTVVINATSINNGSWLEGDTIVLKNGVWTDQTISLRAFGSALKPIVLIAQTPGEVILNGSSRIAISGKYIEVSGIHFKDGTPLVTYLESYNKYSGPPAFEFRTSSSNLAENCRFTDCTISNYNPARIDSTDTKYLSLWGKNNRVDNCTFENKKNLGALMVLWWTPGMIPAHIIENNYFGYRNPLKTKYGAIVNGQEILRFGDSSCTMEYANCIVRNNFFEKCNGEAEIISNKTCGNSYSTNVFLECQGTLTLRSGKDCTVEGNYFIGNGVDSTGGIRVIGEGHKVYNNYFENLKGTGMYAGLSLFRGTPNAGVAEYFQVKNALIVFNTFVNCTQSFCINLTNSETLNTLPPIKSVIAHNHIYNTGPTNTNVIVMKEDAAMDITWKNNLMNLGQYTGFTYNPTQVVTGKNAQMQQVSTPIVMFEPQMGSALTNYTTNDYSNVLSDIRGRSRKNNAKTPGASEIDGVITREMPSISSVGASYLKDFTSTDTTSNDVHPFILSRSIDGYFSIQSTVNGQVHVYDITGKVVEKFKVLAHTRYDKHIGYGIFIVKFSSESGKNNVQKIINL